MHHFHPVTQIKPKLVFSRGPHSFVKSWAFLVQCDPACLHEPQAAQYLGLKLYLGKGLELRERLEHHHCLLALHQSPLNSVLSMHMKTAPEGWGGLFLRESGRKRLAQYALREGSPQLGSEEPGPDLGRLLALARMHWLC